jgi:hypothetical protein
MPDRGHTGWPARQLNDRSFGSFFVWGRLKPDLTITHARAEAAVIAQHLDMAFPVRSPYDPSGRIQRRTWTLRSGSDASRGLDRGDLNRIDALGLAVLFAVITVLFIACTNLANLSLAEGTSRAQEIAVRTALGASRGRRGRLVREYLLERGIVTVAGAGLGLILMRQLTRAFSTDLPISQGLVIHFTPEIDASVFIAAACATTIAFLVMGLWPALQSTRADVRRWLGAGFTATPTQCRFAIDARRCSTLAGSGLYGHADPVALASWARGLAGRRVSRDGARGGDVCESDRLHRQPRSRRRLQASGARAG